VQNRAQKENRLWQILIPASSGIKNVVEMTPAQHAGLVSAFSCLSHNMDVLHIDTAAGI
jgi:flagellar biosynthesis protein FlhG